MVIPKIGDVVWLRNYWKFKFRQNRPIFLKIIFGLKSCLLFSAEFFTENWYTGINAPQNWCPGQLVPYQVNSALNRS